MTLTDILQSQLLDPLRIGLLVALVVTMRRTRAESGVWIPLAAGVVFVAEMLPATIQSSLPLPLWQMAAIGLVANLILLGTGFLLWTLVQRWRG